MTKNLLFLFLLSSTLFSKTYEIVEPDMYDEILSRKDIALEKLKKQKEEQINKWKNYKGSILSVATKNKTVLVDPTYTLTQDIPRVNKYGHKVGVLYPKGYTFNPLKYITIKPPEMIVFNACIVEETKKVKELIKTRYENKTLMLVNSGCKSSDFVDEYFVGKTYYLTEEMVSKFQLKETISIISTNLKTKRIEIEVIKTVN